ncbi:MAG: TrkH family potassium uptake protein [Oscillospiraceae bacterium]|nr:TrkH family potassium uptake protein [Oscillospiraceae bacterium]
MNRKMILSITGSILIAEAAMLLLPMIVSLVYGEACAFPFAVTALGAAIVGLVLRRLCRAKDSTLYAKDGFVTVALSWLAVSLVGAVPFVLSGAIPNYVDALFETVSGFTTTGATILTDVEALPHGLLFWRSFTHWIGGMGVLVFILAIVPSVSDSSIHILRAEMPGPVVGKLVPRARDTASILYGIYLGMTALEIVLLLCGGMPVFDSVVHAFGTAGTGGFGIKADSIAGYSAYLQWVITVFMILFGVNFNLYYLILIRRFRSAAQSTELWSYFGIIGVAVAAVAWNIRGLYSAADAVRHSAFQVASIITTTGFSTVDFDAWPQFSRAVLLLLTVVGACAGSTGGGLKVSRVVMLFKMVRKEIRVLLRPRTVSAVRMEGKPVDQMTLGSVGTYLACYVFCGVVLFLVVSLENFSLETNLSAVLACFNNVGPGLGLVGPLGSYAIYSPLSKLVLSFGMLLGRLEIYPLLIFLHLGSTKRS